MTAEKYMLNIAHHETRNIAPENSLVTDRPAEALGENGDDQLSRNRNRHETVYRSIFTKFFVYLEIIMFSCYVKF